MDDDKPLVMVFPYGQLSHYLRCLTLMKRLRDHFRFIICANKNYQPLIDDEGFTSFECNSPDPDSINHEVQQFNFEWLAERYMEPVLESQINAIQTYKPEAVLGDAIFTLRAAAEYTNTPFLSLLNGYMSKYGLTTRSIPSAIPGSDLVHQLPEGFRNYLISKAEYFTFRRVHKPLRNLRRAFNLPPTEMLLDELEGDYNLICDSNHLFPQDILPNNYRFVGPLIYERSAPIRSRLSRTKGRKQILLSVGSTNDYGKLGFLNDAVFDFADYIVTGDSNRMLYAPHFRHINWYDHSSLLPQIDLFICHGGNGTVYQALVYGIPVLAKTNHFEQQWNMQGVKRLELGDLLDNKDGTEALVAIQHWINQKSSVKFQLTARRLNAEISYFLNDRQLLADAIISVLAEATKKSPRC
jgi:UDP:flavonoid glycosyltransferase YjiC (YdhE family)